jgi:chromosome partitioning protein
MRIIAIANQKGGVGKTTTAINLAYFFGLHGQKTLLIDLDPQANATSGFGMLPDKTIGVYSVLTGEKTLDESIQASGYDNISILTASPLLNYIEHPTSGRTISAVQLKNTIKGLDKKFDTIIIDCPPSLGIFSLNALSAANEVIIPIQCEYFAMEGLSQMINIVDEVKGQYNRNLNIGGILLTMYDPTVQFYKEVSIEVRKHFPDMTYKTMIPRDVSLAESSSFGQPVCVYSHVSRGTYAYMELFREVIGI